VNSKQRRRVERVQAHATRVRHKLQGGWKCKWSLEDFWFIATVESELQRIKDTIEARLLEHWCWYEKIPFTEAGVATLEKVIGQVLEEEIKLPPPRIEVEPPQPGETGSRLLRKVTITMPYFAPVHIKGTVEL
jgi:hypothetical protein